MRRYYSKQEKADIEFRREVAKKFGIQPVSLRASKLLNKYCESASQVREWIESKHILRIRQMGRKTLSELDCAFGFCQHKESGCHHDDCTFSPKPQTNYREMLAEYSQIFRKRIKVNDLI